METTNPLEPHLDSQGVIILDGGLATTLESYGHDLHDPLWSARVLFEDPESITRVHRDFLEAGADCIATASYQASFEGFARRGLNGRDAERLMRLSVELAVEARNEFWSVETNRVGRLRPLVAASIGPYGAFLADGSEYRGEYDIGPDELRDFHRKRWQLLADGPADLLACETIPSREEAAVLLGLLDETPGRWAWISVSCRDGRCLSDGSPLVDVARECDRRKRLAAIGVNCSAPELISPLIGEARAGTAKPVFVYPNRGEGWDAGSKTWRASARVVEWHRLAREWADVGAVGIGGCCRVGPSDITTMREAVLG